MLILAHGGHWLVSVAYVAPVGGFLVWLGWVTIKERRSQARDDPTERTVRRAGS